MVKINNIYVNNGATTKIIMRTRSRTIETIIDTEDVARVSVFNWYPANNGTRIYAVAAISYFEDFKINQAPVKLHRLISSFPENMVDHASGDTLDNRKINLRDATRTQNNRNRGQTKGTITGYKGVFDKKTGIKRFQAMIRFNGERISLGYYSCPHEAAKAYNNKAIELHGDFCRPNELRTKYGLNKEEK